MANSRDNLLSVDSLFPGIFGNSSMKERSVYLYGTVLDGEAYCNKFE